ncbi:MAG: methyltransferase domain-containing protein [Candidatus Obscuribacterales bacterium]|nr:methyltransferase domain-containing protein [Candidatus Obscuribacterales bacterium]
MSQLLAYKDKVAASFSRSATSYAVSAKVQQKAACDLAHLILQQKDNLSQGPILEIGAGTGFLTADLISIFAEREIVVSDISSKMLVACRERMSNHACRPRNLTFIVLDAESLETNEYYAAIATSFALQWFDNLETGLNNLCRAIKPGGSLFFSLPGKESFRQWKNLCHELQLPFTGNDMPSADLLAKIAAQANMELSLKQSLYIEHFADMTTMFKALKTLGAATQRHNLMLNPSQLRLLIAEADKRNPHGIDVCYQIIYGQMIKRG